MILGHERQIIYMNQVLQRERMAHAYLLYGPEHVGKLTFARAVAKTFYCKNYRGSTSIEKVCGVCKDCRDIEGALHPSVTLIDFEHAFFSKKEKRKEISIEDIRELKRHFSLAPQEGMWRIAIINEAERMSGEAANAFLKLLEEPGARTIFFLVTHARELLLPTIISRAQPIRFSTIPDAIIERFLEGCIKSDAERKDLLLYTAGRPGVLMRCLEDREYVVREKKFVQELTSSLQAGIPEALRFSEKVSQDDVLRQKTTAYIIKMCREKILSGIPQRNMREMVAKLKHIDRVATILETTNVHPRLAMDVIFLTAMKNDV